MDPYKPLVELRVEATAGSGTGRWQQLVVPQDFLLWNLHRVVQISLGDTDHAANKLQPSFSYESKPLGAAKSTELCEVGEEEAFLQGKAPLSYSAGGTAFSIKAVDRAMGEAGPYLPRCINSSEPGDLDWVNQELAISRFSKDMQRNKKKRQLPSVYAPPWISNKQLMADFLGAMRLSVHADEKWANPAAKAAEEEAADKTGRKAANAAKAAGSTKRRAAAQAGAAKEGEGKAAVKSRQKRRREA